MQSQKKRPNGGNDNDSSGKLKSLKDKIPSGVDELVREAEKVEQKKPKRSGCGCGW